MIKNLNTVEIILIIGEGINCDEQTKRAGRFIVS